MTDEPRMLLLVEANPDDEELTIRELARAKLKNRDDVARDWKKPLRAYKDAQGPSPLCSARPQASERSDPSGAGSPRVPGPGAWCSSPVPCSR